MRTLHLTNGDSAAMSLAASGLTGDVLPWRDVLHDGPVPPDENPADFRMARAKFFATRGWTDLSEVLSEFVARDAALQQIGAGDEAVLWFEPDLYDQLQLLQLLAHFERRDVAARPAITIAPADCYLGPLEGPAFVPLFEARRTVRDRDLLLGRDLWNIITSRSHTHLFDWVKRMRTSIPERSYTDSSQVRTPYFAHAISRFLEEYPSVGEGLSRTERQACELLLHGPMSMGDLFVAQQQREEWFFLGDLSFAWYLQRISECLHPLVTFTDGTRVSPPDGEGDARDYWSRAVKLTDIGRDVVGGLADAIHLNGIDRWIGGVYNTTGHYFRWDPLNVTLLHHGD